MLARALRHRVACSIGTCHVAGLNTLNARKGITTHDGFYIPATYITCLNTLNARKGITTDCGRIGGGSGGSV